MIKNKFLTAGLLLLVLCVGFLSCGCSVLKFSEMNLQNEGDGPQPAPEPYPLPESVDPEKPEPLTVDDFCDKANGYWGCQLGEYQWNIIEIKDGLLSDYAYYGHVWVKDADITSVEEQETGWLKVAVTYEYVEMGEDGPGEIIEDVYTLKSDDDFRRNLTVEGVEQNYNYIYLGSTMEEVDNYIGIF